MIKNIWKYLNIVGGENETFTSVEKEIKHKNFLSDHVCVLFVLLGNVEAERHSCHDIDRYIFGSNDL